MSRVDWNAGGHGITRTSDAIAVVEIGLAVPSDLAAFQSFLRMKNGS